MKDRHFQRTSASFIFPVNPKPSLTTLFRRIATSLGTVLACFPSSARAIGFDQQSYTPTHDTFIQRGAPTTTAGTGDEFLVKRDSATVSGGSDRIGYLRFSTAAPYTVVDSASLFISFNNYPGDGTTPFTFEVFGLPDGHAERVLRRVAAHLQHRHQRHHLDARQPEPRRPHLARHLHALRRFRRTRVEFTTTALRDFIAASGNSELTFIIFRQTPNAGLPTYFASSEDATSTKRPTLLIRTSSDSLAVANTTASSTLTGSAAANATDSNFTTRWIANADTSSTKSWITLDLGSPQTVNRLNFIAYQHGRSYKLESSDNNSTWSLITTDFRSGVGTGVNPLLQDTNRYFQPRSARYFRLSSLTSTTGNSLSLWEVKLYNDSAAAPSLARLASLTSSVSALPNSSNPEQLKRVVLELALERAQACLNIGDFAAANLLLDDAENNLATDPATMAAVATGVTQVRAIRPLIETTPATNPYLKRINDGAALYLSNHRPPLGKEHARTQRLRRFQPRPHHRRRHGRPALGLRPPEQRPAPPSGNPPPPAPPHLRLPRCHQRPRPADPRRPARQFLRRLRQRPRLHRLPRVPAPLPRPHPRELEHRVGQRHDHRRQQPLVGLSATATPPGSTPTSPSPWNSTTSA